MKKLFFLTGLLFYLLLPANVLAEMSININCPPGVPPGQDVTCTIHGFSDTGLFKSVTADIQYSDNIEYISITNESGWSQVSTKNNLLAEHNEGYTGNKIIATLQLKLKASGADTANITFSNIVIKDSSSNEVSMLPIIKNIKVLSTNNKLASLTVDDKTVPNFNADTLTYSLTSTTNSSLKVGATLADSKASFITGFGPRTVNLNYGDNTIQIKTKSEDGKSETYTINVVRNDTRSNNNNLKTLTVSDGTITFKPDILKYDVIVDNNSTQISATLADDKARFITGFGPRTVDLSYEKAIFEIKVKAENDDIRTYTLNISQKDNRSQDTTLKGITLSVGKINFKPSVYYYNVMVAYDVTKMDISAVTNEKSAVMEITGNEDLLIGNNIFTIEVTAENGAQKTYTINVRRLDVNEKMPTPDLNNIKIKNYSLNFDNNKTEYTLKIKKEDVLDIEVFPIDSRTVVKIYGNKDLTDGSKINIVSISIDGTTKEFIINIEKSGFSIMLVILVIGGIVIGLLIWLILFKIPQNKDNEIDLNDKKMDPQNEDPEVESKEKSITTMEPDFVFNKIPLQEVDEKDETGASPWSLNQDIPSEEIEPIAEITTNEEEKAVQDNNDNLIDEINFITESNDVDKSKTKKDKSKEEKDDINIPTKYKNKFFIDDDSEESDSINPTDEIMGASKNIPGKICPNCKMVNDLDNKTCFFCKTSL
ncbi:MAG: cadherin-like beta sandwich domain-containing protein [Bacilli bacterium]|nr:cadherin-like beta sandwich domain-containing protein [Bacilli bacterium]